MQRFKREMRRRRKRENLRAHNGPREMSPRLRAALDAKPWPVGTPKMSASFKEICG